MNTTRPHALVAGAAGLVGSALCRLLLNQGVAVVAWDNLLTGSEDNLAELFNHPHFRFQRVDICQTLPPLEETIGQIYHMASPASPDDFAPLALEIIAANTQGTLNLLHLAQQKSAKLLFASTSEVYGNPLVHPQIESYWGNVNPNGPRSCYDESKRLGESLVLNHARLHDTRTVIARIFNTYGPRMRLNDGRVVPNFLLAALRGEPLSLHGGGQQTRSFCYVDDLVAGLKLLCESPHTDHEVYNLGNPQEYTIEVLATAICEIAGVPVHLHSKSPARIDDPERRCPNIQKIKTTLGWEPQITLHEGLSRCWEDFKTRIEESA